MTAHRYDAPPPFEIPDEVFRFTTPRSLTVAERFELRAVYVLANADKLKAEWREQARIENPEMTKEQLQAHEDFASQLFGI